MNVCEFCHEDRDGYVTHLNREGIGSAHIMQSHPINGGWMEVCGASWWFTMDWSSPPGSGPLPRSIENSI